MSDVSGLPGGQALAALADKVKGGDPEAIRDIAKRWRKAGGDIVGKLNAVGTAITLVDADWKGESADAFVTYMRKYGTAGDALNTALSNCADSLDKAANAVESAKKNVDAVCDAVVKWVGDYRRENPGASEDDLKPGIQKEVAAGVTQAQGYIDTAEDALSTAQREIGKYLGEATPTFADIPPAGDQSFVPGPGHKTQWVRAPKEEIDKYFARETYGDAASAGTLTTYGPSSGGSPAPSGQVKDWIQQAVDILKAQGVDPSLMNPDDIARRIQIESSGNPNAINNWDSNAAAGHPSKGIMQMIDPTFERWSIPGHRDIFNPVDNIVAAVRYAINRYGSMSNLPDGGY
ncbi:WXG100 family type VII secretion target [Sphaerisporangium fuscum]|uniref:WXG100 family type VII secretion target n=1 Tax=Sphaerisporangium fuscum TaxID=2835868 RepID=UPI001BDBD701|nr:WXG100 family type VII secretion target [Sphaerisporangium fuscum]